MYWLKNEQHGRMPVSELSEVERLKLFGWVLFFTGENPPTDAPEEPQAQEPEPKRRVRPPKVVS